MSEIVGFEVHVPATGAELRRNVEYALSLGLPDLPRAPPRDGRLTILANGPSALDCPLHGDILALNGAMGLFHNSGRLPMAWAACDPQALVADLLPDVPPMGVSYLVASKCHRAVFDKLRDRKVVLWHLNEDAYFDLVLERDPIRLAPSVTICALELGERLGYRASETWGWDGCYRDGLNHAVAQGHDGTGNCDVEIGKRVFRTTRNWMFEAACATDRFADTPRDVIIHGDGMIDAWCRFEGVNPRLEIAA